MTPDELKQALTDAGWRISPSTIRRDAKVSGPEGAQRRKGSA